VERTNLFSRIEDRIENVHEADSAANGQGVLLSVNRDVSKGRQVNLHAVLQLGQFNVEPMLARAREKWNVATGGELDLYTIRDDWRAIKGGNY